MPFMSCAHLLIVVLQMKSSLPLRCTSPKVHINNQLCTSSKGLPFFYARRFAAIMHGINYVYLKWLYLM